MKKVILTLVLVSFLGIPAIMAQKAATGQNKSISDVSLAWEFAQYGYNNSSALALITAAQILYTVPTSTQPQATIDATSPEFSSKQLLDDAKKLAKGDQSTLAMITKVEADKPEKSRGSQAELLAYNFKLSAGTSKTYNITYNGGADAVVSIKSNSKTTPTIVVKDSKGQTVTTSPGNEPGSVKWTPTKNELFQVTVKNADPDEAKCILITN